MSTCSSLMPSFASSLDERDEPRDRVGERRRLGQLRADVAVDADDLRGRRASPRRGTGARASAIATPNLFCLRPVEMYGWVSRIDVGVDAQRDRARACRALRATASSTSSSSADSTLKQPMPASSAGFISRSVLPTPENTTLLGIAAGAQPAIQLADRDDVGAGAELDEHAEHAERRVRLHRVADLVRDAVERGVERRVRALELAAAVDVDRRADLRRRSSPAGRPRSTARRAWYSNGPAMRGVLLQLGA